MWYREKHLNRLETLIHFTEKKTIIEAQLVAFSAEIVFLAATKDPSLTSVATAHRYVDTSVMPSCGAIIALPPKARVPLLQSSPENGSPLFCYKPVSYVASYWWIWGHVTTAAAKKFEKTGQVL